MGISTGEVATASDVRKLRTLSKLQHYTRLSTTASGDVTYTGFGFRPNTIFAIGQTGETTGTGMYASAQAAMWQHTTHSSYASGKIIAMGFGGGSSVTHVTASVLSVASDGFTINWGTSSVVATVSYSLLAMGDTLV